VRLGASSWSSDGWAGPFYPEGTPPAEFLEIYASRYDTVEVDTTFYRIPAPRLVDGWRARTPEGFVFAAKVPRSVTHEKGLVGCEDEMAEFLGVMRRLGDRLGPLLLQFPYVAKRADAREYETGDSLRARLGPFLAALPGDLRYVVEIRNEKWIAPPLLDLLRGRGIALALVDYFTMPPIGKLLSLCDPVTADFLYVRFLGDHKRMDRLVADEEARNGTKPWSRIVVDRGPAMRAWAAALRSLSARVGNSFVFVNNHYAGYAPGSIDLLRALLTSDGAPA